jgi:serine protease AprX
MKKYLFAFGCIIASFFLLSSSPAYSQKITARFMVSFADKSGTPYSVSAPQDFLSQRAVQRRSKFAIPVTVQDLPVSPKYIDTLVNRGFPVLGTSKWFNAALIESNDSAAVMDLLNLPFVTAVDLLYYTNTAKSAGNKGSKSLEFSNNFGNVLQHQSQFMKGATSSGINYGFGFSQANMLGATYLHQMGFSGENVVIAVLDGGFSFADTLPVFDSLRMQNRILTTHNFVKPGETVYGSSTHGMMVLSTMGGNIPGTLVGTAPHASYHLLLTEDVADEFPVEEFYYGMGAEYADSVGADLINSSLGYTTFDLSLLDHQPKDMDGNHSLSSKAASIAAAKGILVVTAAGNGGGSSWFYISSPGDADSIITVGAVDVSANYAPFSSTGPTVDDRVKPDVAAVGWNATIASTGGGATTGNGTSFATPVMCGALACLRQANDSVPVMKLIEAVQRSGNQWFAPDTLLGYGIPNLAVAHLVLGGQPIPKIEDKEFKIAPNPFNDRFLVTFYATDTQQITIEIYDLRGRKYYGGAYQKLTGLNVISVPDPGNMASGTYILKIQDGRNTITRKIIRQ